MRLFKCVINATCTQATTLITERSTNTRSITPQILLFENQALGYNRMYDGLNDPTVTMKWIASPEKAKEWLVWQAYSAKNPRRHVEDFHLNVSADC